MKSKSMEMTAKLSSIEQSSEEFRKNLINKLTATEQHSIEEFRNVLNKILSQDNKAMVMVIRKLYKEFKTIAWLVELSSMSRLLTDLLERKI
ncbi:MAG: hypothetical protein QW739_02430 [Candidatus Odinarchaeota archaeon]